MTPANDLRQDSGYYTNRSVSLAFTERKQVQVFSSVASIRDRNVKSQPPADQGNAPTHRFLETYSFSRVPPDGSSPTCFQPMDAKTSSSMVKDGSIFKKAVPDLVYVSDNVSCVDPTEAVSSEEDVGVIVEVERDEGWMAPSSSPSSPDVSDDVFENMLGALWEIRSDYEMYPGESFVHPEATIDTARILAAGEEGRVDRDGGSGGRGGGGARNPSGKLDETCLYERGAKSTEVAEESKLGEGENLFFDGIDTDMALLFGATQGGIAGGEERGRDKDFPGTGFSFREAGMEKGNDGALQWIESLLEENLEKEKVTGAVQSHEDTRTRFSFGPNLSDASSLFLKKDVMGQKDGQNSFLESTTTTGSNPFLPPSAPLIPNTTESLPRKPTSVMSSDPKSAVGVKPGEVACVARASSPLLGRQSLVPALSAALEEMGEKKWRRTLQQLKERACWKETERNDDVIGREDAERGGKCIKLGMRGKVLGENSVTVECNEFISENCGRKMMPNPLPSSFVTGGIDGVETGERGSENGGWVTEGGEFERNNVGEGGEIGGGSCHEKSKILVGSNIIELFNSDSSGFALPSADLDGKRGEGSEVEERVARGQGRNVRTGKKNGPAACFMEPEIVKTIVNDEGRSIKGRNRGRDFVGECRNVSEGKGGVLEEEGMETVGVGGQGGEEAGGGGERGEKKGKGGGGMGSEGSDAEASKRQMRMMRNRFSALQSRQRKKSYVSELEGKCAMMEAQIAHMRQIVAMTALENGALRDEVLRLQELQRSSLLNSGLAGDGRVLCLRGGGGNASVSQMHSRAHPRKRGGADVGMRGQLGIKGRGKKAKLGGGKGGGGCEPTLCSEVKEQSSEAGKRSEDECERPYVGNNHGAEPAVLESDSLPSEFLPHARRNRVFLLHVALFHWLFLLLTALCLGLSPASLLHPHLMHLPSLLLLFLPLLSFFPLRFLPPLPPPFIQRKSLVIPVLAGIASDIDGGLLNVRCDQDFNGQTLKRGRSLCGLVRGDIGRGNGNFWVWMRRLRRVKLESRSCPYPLRR